MRETRPGSAISIIETDCQVDFEAPKDYVEPQRQPPPAPVLPAAQPKQGARPRPRTARTLGLPRASWACRALRAALRRSCRRRRA